MRDSSRSNRLQLSGAVLLALLLAVVASLDIARKVESFQPLGFEARAEGGQYVVTTVSVPPVGLKAGDGILLVDGAQPMTADALRATLTSEPESQLVVLRGDELLQLVYARPGIDIDVSYLMLAFSGVIFLLVGLYALFQSRHAPSGLFFLWCLMSAAVYLLTFVPSPDPDLLSRASFLVEETARLVLPALTVHLFLLFPTPLLPPRRLRLLTPFLYLPSAVLGALQADLVFGDGQLIFGRVTPGSIQLLDRLELALIVSASLAAVVLLLWQLAQSETWEQRRQLQWIATGLGAGYLPFLVLYVLPWGLGLDWPEWTTIAAVAPLSLVPLAFAWAILRYRLWDLELILRDTIAYSATLMLGALSFSLLHLAISKGLADDQRLVRNILTFVAGLAVAGVLVPTQRAVRTGIERLRHRGAWEQRQALSRLGRELLEERRLDRLGERLLTDLRTGLGVSRLDLYLVEGERLRAIDVETALPVTLALAAVEESAWQGPHESLPAPAGLATAKAPLDTWFAAGYRYLFPLAERDRKVGLMLAGHRDDGLPLDSEELQLVRNLLDQAALALENAYLVSTLQDRLMEVNRLKQYSERILESSPAGIVVVDRGGQVVSANQSFSRIIGLGDTSATGFTVTDLVPIDPVAIEGSGPVGVQVIGADGRERHLQVSTARATQAESDLRVMVFQDVTDLVAMEVALEEKERLAALGLLAAGVAHEVNTPLTGISSYAQMLLAETGSDDPRHELLEKMERQTFRASRIVNNLLELAREEPTSSRPTSVESAIEEALEAAEAKLAAHSLEVEWERSQQSALAMAGETELQRVFANLVSNAIDAMAPDGGGRLRLQVETRGDRIVTVVEDSGCGMSREQLAQIFEPFYTTKTGRGGTGLGLSISHQIIQRFGGTLRATSTPGAGSRFEVEPPVAPHTAEEPS